MRWGWREKRGRSLTGADGAEGGGWGCHRQAEHRPKVAAVDGLKEGEARETPQEEASGVALRFLQWQDEGAVHRHPRRRWRREAGGTGGWTAAAAGGRAGEEAGLLVFGHSCNPLLHCYCRRGASSAGVWAWAARRHAVCRFGWGGGRGGRGWRTGGCRRREADLSRSMRRGEGDGEGLRERAAGAMGWGSGEGEAAEKGLRIHFIRSERDLSHPFADERCKMNRLFLA
jgi:hypothetical protein